MKNSRLFSISPIDGRYSSHTETLRNYFSEYGLIRYRVWVEIEYFIALCELPLSELALFPKDKFSALRTLYLQFTEAAAQEIKDIEKTTNHDVKAVEYYLKNKFEEIGISEFKEFIHFGITSQDINNTATPLLLKEFIAEHYMPTLKALINVLEKNATDWNDVAMLARTHGQPASPTRLGKEINVFVSRLKMQKRLLETIPHSGKFGGATGNFNAHHVAYPSIDWTKFGVQLLSEKFDLIRSTPTTQIEHYDNMAALFDALKRINTILIDFSRDIWQYVSMNYFSQLVEKGEVGSSAMPHKVNPIDFENAEGNLGLANALYEHLAAKLPISRLQRDLTDSTVLRNIGVPLAHTIIAFHSLQKGIARLALNPEIITKDLDDNWTVVAEAIQTILRKEGYPNPYETLKELTQKNEKITQHTLAAFIDTLAIRDELKKQLKSISPFNYTGI